LLYFTPPNTPESTGQGKPLSVHEVVPGGSTCRWAEDLRLALEMLLDLTNW